jgi:hypothetical protein
MKYYWLVMAIILKIIPSTLSFIGDVAVVSASSLKT